MMGYLVSYYLVLDRVPQRRIQDDLYLIALDKAHFLHTLTESPVTVHLDDHSTLTCL